MVPASDNHEIANDNHESPPRETIELALLLRPLWSGLVLGLLAGGWLVYIVG